MKSLWRGSEWEACEERLCADAACLAAFTARLMNAFDTNWPLNYWSLSPPVIPTVSTGMLIFAQSNNSEAASHANSLGHRQQRRFSSTSNMVTHPIFRKKAAHPLDDNKILAAYLGSNGDVDGTCAMCNVCEQPRCKERDRQGTHHNKCTQTSIGDVSSALRLTWARTQTWVIFHHMQHRCSATMTW